MQSMLTVKTGSKIYTIIFIKSIRTKITFVRNKVSNRCALINFSDVTFSFDIFRECFFNEAE